LRPDQGSPGCNESLGYQENWRGSKAVKVALQKL